MASPIHSFEDLECWKAARELRIFVAKQILPILPREERFRLGDQALRAARSITANIAEGYGRYHYLDNLKFCSNARGSCTELLDHLITAVDESLMKSELLDVARSKIDHALRVLNGYMAYLRRTHSAAEEP